MLLGIYFYNSNIMLNNIFLNNFNQTIKSCTKSTEIVKKVLAQKISRYYSLRKVRKNYLRNYYIIIINVYSFV